MEMDYGIISCIPITVLMVGVLLTKRITEMMVIASLLGAIFMTIALKDYKKEI